MTHHRPLVLLAALLACAACSTYRGAVPGRSSLLTDAPAPVGRPCRPANVPEQLPAADALVDSAALTARVAELWRRAGSPAGHAVLAMGYDVDGLNVRRDVIEHRLPDALADTLQKLVFAHRRSVRPAPREWGVRMRMDLDGEQPVLRVGRRELCAAQPRDASMASFSSFGGPAFADVRERNLGPGLLATSPGTIWVRVALDAGGNVMEARVERTMTRGLWENRVLSYVRGITFVPATEDGQPVPAQLMFPLRLTQ